MLKQPTLAITQTESASPRIRFNRVCGYELLVARAGENFV